MPLKTIFTLLLVLALVALGQAGPVNLTSLDPASIPENLNGSMLPATGIERLGSTVERRNPPGWDQVPTADNEVLSIYETQGRVWFSPMIYLSLVPPGPQGPGGAANPVNSRPFNQHMSSRWGADPQGDEWQREKIWGPHIIREWSQRVVTHDHAPSFTAMQPILSALPLDQFTIGTDTVPVRSGDAHTSQPGHNLCVEMAQDVDYPTPDKHGNHLGPKEQATGAFWRNWYNVVDGVFVIDDGKAVQAGSREHMPVYRSFQDVTWQVWKKMRTERKPQRGNLDRPGGWGQVSPLGKKRVLPQLIGLLNWIVVSGVKDQRTQTIIERCFHERRSSTDLPVCTPDQSQQCTFIAGHWCFNALLATQSSTDIALFLGQHKKPGALGHKLLSGVAITSGHHITPENAEKAENPTLVWQVTDYRPEIVAKIIRQQQHYLSHRNAKGQVSYADVPQNV